MRLLITGFGPFPRVPRNPTETYARALAADPRWRRLGIEARALVLPTTYGAVDEILLPALARERWDAVLMLGVAARRHRITPETRAVNRVTRRLPDASGRLPESLSYRPGAPFALSARMPIAPLLDAMRAAARRRTSVAPSRDAGRYLCNAASYAALAVDEGPAALVFVHVPMPRGLPTPWLGGRAGRTRPDAQETLRVLRAAALAVTRAARSPSRDRLRASPSGA